MIDLRIPRPQKLYNIYMIDSTTGVVAMLNDDYEILLKISSVKDPSRFYRAALKVHNKYKKQYGLILNYVPGEEISFSYSDASIISAENQRDLSKTLLEEVQVVAKDMLVRPEFVPCDQPLITE
jgi:hypothetical protein